MSRFKPPTPPPWTIRRIGPDDRWPNGSRVGLGYYGWVAIDTRDGGRFFRLTRRGAERAVYKYEKGRWRAAQTEYEYEPFAGPTRSEQEEVVGQLRDSEKPQPTKPASPLVTKNIP